MVDILQSLAIIILAISHFFMSRWLSGATKSILALGEHLRSHMAWHYSREA